MSAPAPRRLAITNVTVVPMAGARRHLPDHGLLVDSGRVRALAPTAELDTRGAEIVDGTGGFLLPQLADMHVHAWDPSSWPLYLVNGITQLRNMWGSPLHLAWEQAVRRGDVPGPHIATTSPIIDGPGETGFPVWPGSYIVRSSEEASHLVERFVERCYRQIKAYQWLEAATLAAICEAAARAGVLATRTVSLSSRQLATACAASST
jgi:hypothetical protein